MSSSTFAGPFFLSFIFILSSLLSVRASVPPSKTFKYFNVEDTGFFKEISSEYGDYLCTPIEGGVFTLCFKNSTPNVFTLSILMGTLHSNSPYHWVWDANRARPVGENASLTFGRDGNFVLADVDGTIAWQTNTANKGVVGLKILPNGNLVLYDAKGRFVWQSFDFPSDTLLMGQYLRPTPKGPNKLVSRKSDEDITEGPYSLVLEPDQLSLYYKSENSPTSQRYFATSNVEHFGSLKGAINMTFGYNPDLLSACDMHLNFPNLFELTVARIKWNCTYSFLRLDADGNLRIYSYLNELTAGDSWEVTRTFLAKDSLYGSECLLPERCGEFGLCDENQCVACPTPKGLRGWWKGCKSRKPSSCKDFKYYKLEGVDRYSSQGKGIGPTKEANCEKKCSTDCKCMGYFYNKASSMCWIAYDLKTLNRVWNSTHVGFIKAPRH